jgi:hypothetical protein
MKTTIEIELMPFIVPNCVHVVSGVSDVVGSYPLSAIDAQTLDKMCSNFRRAVFKQAGKEMPPTCR